MSSLQPGTPVHIDIVKKQAKRLVSALKEQLPLQHSQGLELMAKVHGHESWGHLNALLTAPEQPSRRVDEAAARSDNVLGISRDKVLSGLEWGYNDAKQAFREDRCLVVVCGRNQQGIARVMRQLAHSATAKRIDGRVKNSGASIWLTRTEYFPTDSAYLMSRFLLKPSDHYTPERSAHKDIRLAVAAGYDTLILDQVLNRDDITSSSPFVAANESLRRAAVGLEAGDNASAYTKLAELATSRGRYAPSDIHDGKLVLCSQNTLAVLCPHCSTPVTKLALSKRWPELRDRLPDANYADVGPGCGECTAGYKETAELNYCQSVPGRALYAASPEVVEFVAEGLRSSSHIGQLAAPALLAGLISPKQFEAIARPEPVDWSAAVAPATS